MKILYWSCHEILEYDDLRMLTSEGHEVFSLGVYASPDAVGHFRRSEPEFHRGDHFAAYVASASTGPENVDPEFAARFDIAFVNHMPEWAIAAVNCMRGRPVVYRSIGQSNRATEAALAPYKGKIHVVRYSEHERRLPGFLPCDEVIYFAKNPADFAEPWVGGMPPVTFHNSYPDRSFASTPHVEEYGELAMATGLELWGAANETVPCSRGLAAPTMQGEIFRKASAYFYVPTVPPSYTLSFMEALAWGTPILAPTASFIEQTVSRAHLENSGFSTPRYEVEALLDHKSTMLYSTLAEARDKLNFIVANKELAQQLSAFQRRRFQEKFSSARIGPQWSRFFEAIAGGRHPVGAGSATAPGTAFTADQLGDAPPEGAVALEQIMEETKTPTAPSAVRHRWARRELAFIVVGLVIIVALALFMANRNPPGPARGAPLGDMPTGSAAPKP